MPTSPPSPCSRCGQKAVKRGLCAKHYGAYERGRGNSTQRGYGQAHRDDFRAPVLDACGHVCEWPQGCTAEAVVADHYPTSRRDLVKQGKNPNDPQYGRGLCQPHHRHWTAVSTGFGQVG